MPEGYFSFSGYEMADDMLLNAGCTKPMMLEILNYLNRNKKRRLLVKETAIKLNYNLGTYGLTITI